MKKRLNQLFLILLLLLVSVFAGCANADKTGDGTGFFYSELDNNLYSINLKEQLGPTYHNFESAYFALNDGAVCELYEDSVYPLLNQNMDIYWYPVSASTVVIGVDRSKTDLRIESFEDILENDLTYCIPYERSKYTRYALWTMYKGIMSDDNMYASFIGMLSHEYHTNRLVKEPDAADVIIGFDDTMLFMVSNPEDYEIILPSEGTYSFRRGLVSTHPLDLSELGLADVTSKIPEGSTLMNDYSEFNNTVERSSRNFRRLIFHESIYSSTDKIEHILMPAIFIVIYMLWLGLSMKRIINPYTRKIIHTTGIIIVMWVMVRFIKYQMTSLSTASRYLWYIYYIFELGTALCTFWMAEALGDSNAGKLTYKLKLKLSAISVYLVLIGLILTNDLHQLVFIFDINGNWDSDYSYGFVFYIIAAVGIATMVVSFIILIGKAASGYKRKGAVAGAVLLIFFILYSTCFITGVKWATNSDFTMIYTFLALLFNEVCMISGLIPRNAKYNKLFSHSPLKMQIVNKTGATVLKSLLAIPIDRQIFIHLRNQGGEYFDSENNTMLYYTEIKGGAVIWQEDINELVLMNKEINRNIRLLESSNKVLAIQRERQARKASDDNKTKLQNRLENEIKAKYELMINMIGDLSAKEDKKLEVARITLLLVNIKRRCNLFFRELETLMLPADELCVYIDELAEFARFTGVIMLTCCSVKQDIPSRRATLIYDFIYAVLRQASIIGEYNVIEQLSMSEDCRIDLKLLLSDFIQDLGGWELELRTKIIENNGRVEFKQLDDCIGISLSFD